MPQKILSVNSITIRLKTSLLFENTSWEMQRGEQWLIVGPNGAGKTTFAKALAGLVPLKYGEIKTRFSKKRIKYVSFDTEQAFLQKEERQKEFTSYVGQEKKGKTVKLFLGKHSQSELFGISDLLNQEITTLSTGELRKVFLTKVISSKPKLLILDEPYSGLDKNARKELEVFLNKLAKMTQILLIAHNLLEIPAFITHVMVIEDEKILDSGSKEIMPVVHPQYFQKTRRMSPFQTKPSLKAKKVLIEMNNVSVNYGKKKIVSSVSWKVYQGEHWALLGPNGAGKSTLVKLITGDALQVYANDICLFDKKRGELSLWEIRKHIGYVSSELQLQYDKNIKTLDVILSGFFDSIGLYAKPMVAQRRKAQELIKKLGLESISQRQFNELSQGQKRLILLARAVVKSPTLLILDEPCSSLDAVNRRKMLDIIETIAQSGKTTVLLITHHEEEIVPSITNVLRLKNGKIVVQ